MDSLPFEYVVKEVTDNMENFELGVAVQKVYDFIWDEFCDWYIEMVKPRLYATDDADSQNAALWTLKTVLIDALKLLHPYMPFITEEIFCTLQSEEESIMISSWPVYQQERHFEKEEQEIEILKEAVRGVRNVRTSMNVPPSRKAHVYVVSDQKELQYLRGGQAVLCIPGERIRCDLSGGQDRYRRGRGIRCDPERNPLYSICRAG